MVSGEPGFYDTRAAALWDDAFLYVAFWAEEPFVQASLTERDSRTFLESVVDRGWSVELAIPWSGITAVANNRSLPPREGDVWRMFFGRFEKLNSAGKEIQPHPAWVWTPHASMTPTGRNASLLCDFRVKWPSED